MPIASLPSGRCATRLARTSRSPPAARVRSLVIAGEAQVPLHSGVTTRFVVFRDAVGGAPVAIVVGTPDFSRPVPVRLHSACLTGDVFGSRRCDCGDQLRLALTSLQKT